MPSLHIKEASLKKKDLSVKEDIPKVLDHSSAALSSNRCRLFP